MMAAGLNPNDPASPMAPGKGGVLMHALRLSGVLLFVLFCVFLLLNVIYISTILLAVELLVAPSLKER